MAGKRAVRVGGGALTVRAQFSRSSERHVPGWDKEVGVAQKMARVAERSDMGHKMTPIGCGTATCKDK